MSHNTGTDTSDPIAFFITWPTYGTWLPGDQRGWVEYKHGWQLPRPVLELECRSRMKEDACILTTNQRGIVEAQVQETCDHRGWTLLAAQCRTNHMHIVVAAAATDPKKIRRDIKAWCTRRLKEKCDPSRENWWAERGSIRWIWNDDSLAMVIQYVQEAQDRKHLEPPFKTRNVSEGRPVLSSTFKKPKTENTSNHRSKPET